MTGWTTSDLAKLERNAHLGAAVVASHLGRSVWSVKWKAYELRISLRRRGHARGHLLGQPRTTTLPVDVRALALRGIVDLDPDSPPAVCPHCGRFYVTEASGVCRPCRTKAKLDAYVENNKAALIASQPLVTEYNRQKQQMSRFRRGLDLKGDE